MPKLKTLSGKEIVDIFISYGFEVASQRGSHIKLRKISVDEHKQTLTIPNHLELDKGTLRAIYRQSLGYIIEEDLFNNFYSE
ncbi:MAG: type II toxin-antitoxin system HicA family toxin [bacterium]|nr:type II toxin-antitoxin system HicA family toxin [bacterium]